MQIQNKRGEQPIRKKEIIFEIQVLYQTVVKTLLEIQCIVKELNGKGGIERVRFEVSGEQNKDFSVGQNRCNACLISSNQSNSVSTLKFIFCSFEWLGVSLKSIRQEFAGYPFLWSSVRAFWVRNDLQKIEKERRISSRLTLCRLIWIMWLIC